MNKRVGKHPSLSGREPLSESVPALILFLVLLAMCGQHASAALQRAPDVLWAHEAGGPHIDVPGLLHSTSLDDQANAVASDGKGAAYVTGKFTKYARFGGVEINSPNASDSDLFLVKYDSSGTPVWAKQGGGAGHEWDSTVAMGPDGSVVWAGFCFAPASIDGQKVEPSAYAIITNDFPATVTDSCYFVAKYDSNGNRLWLHFVRVGYSPGGQTRVAVDPAGNTYLLGTFWRVMDFEGQIINTPGPGNWDNSFVAKYDSTGQLQWAKRTSATTGYDCPTGLDVDVEGNLYVSGWVDLAISFGPVNLDRPPCSDPSSGDCPGVGQYVAKLDSTGNGLWAKTLGSQRNSPVSIRVDASGNAYVASVFGDSGPSEFIKFDPYGKELWRSDMGGGNFFALACDAAGNTVIAMRTSGSLFQTFTGQSGADGTAVVSFDSSGALRWAHSFADAGGGAIPVGLAQDSPNSWCMVGWFEGYAILDGIRLQSPFPGRDAEVFVARLGYPATTAVPLITVQPQNTTTFETRPAGLQVAASSISPLSYQWRFNGLPISYARSNTLTFTNATLDENGTFSVTVSNANGFVDSSNASITVLPLTKLGEALNATNLQWRLGGIASWNLDTNITHDGVAALRTDNPDYIIPQDGLWIPANAFWMETTVTGPGVLSFWWKASTYAWPLEPDGALRFLLDDVEQFAIWGEVDWQPHSLPIGPGSHVLRWWKSWDGGSGGAASYFCWVDQVTFSTQSGGAPRITGTTSLTNGQFQLSISGPTGATIGIEACSDLKSWLPVGQVTATNGAVTFTHQAAGNYPAHFYRAVLIGP